MFKIPDVDLLQQIYEGAIKAVRLAPNNEESATITFNTGVVQDFSAAFQHFHQCPAPHTHGCRTE